MRWVPSNKSKDTFEKVKHQLIQDFKKKPLNKFGRVHVNRLFDSDRSPDELQLLYEPPPTPESSKASLGTKSSSKFSSPEKEPTPETPKFPCREDNQVKHSNMYRNQVPARYSLRSDRDDRRSKVKKTSYAVLKVNTNYIIRRDDKQVKRSHIYRNQVPASYSVESTTEDRRSMVKELDEFSNSETNSSGIFPRLPQNPTDVSLPDELLEETSHDVSKVNSNHIMKCQININNNSGTSKTNKLLGHESVNKELHETSEELQNRERLNLCSTVNEDSVICLSEKFISMRLPIHGFPNPPPTTYCWMNASLQVILRMKYLVSDIIKNDGLSTNSIICEFINFVKCYVQNDSSEDIFVHLRTFKNSLAEWKYDFHSARQQDAAEFIMCFLQHIGEKSYSQEIIKSIEDKVHLKFERKLLCTLCKHELKSIPEDVMVYHMNLDTNQVISIQDKLEQEMASITKDISCNLCNGKEGRQTIHIVKLPIYLIIELNRVLDGESVVRKEVNLTSHLNMKNWTKTHEEIETSLGSDYNSSHTYKEKNNLQTDDANYRLTSVIFHQGQQAKEGHYVADVYDQEENMWYHFNDSFVDKKEATSDKFGQSRMLIYTKMCFTNHNS